MSAVATSPFLDMHALASLARMRFTTRQRIEGAYGGRHHSRVPGGAGEFSDFREYGEGDDFRRVDWKVLSRTGRAYVRVFHDETNLRCLVVIDASRSMQFGSDGRIKRRSKLEYVQLLATALTYLVIRQQDQAGVAIVAKSLTKLVAPGGTNEHAAQVYEAIADIVPVQSTQLSPGLAAVFQRVSRGGVLLVLSDFLVDDLDDAFAQIRLFRHRRWDVVVLHVIDPEEEQLPMGAAFRFEGLEGEGSVCCSPADIRDAYAKRFAAHAAMVRSMALAAGCDYHRVSTAVPYLGTLSRFLVARSG